ncbi:MAG: MBL fold metallo-hydrolase [Halioglobus sp.]|nr:MBL fold metallo-hydrolase [Halioglobus sp.]
MNRERTAGTAQRGRAAMWLLAALAIAAGLWWILGGSAGGELKKQAQLKTLEVIGGAAARRLEAGAEGDGTHGSAVELIKRPIEVRKVADNVYYATGVGNTVMVTTDEGNVIFDTGLVLQVAQQRKALREISDGPIRYIVLSHSHADHIGGTRFWQEAGTEIIAHEQFTEEQRYLSELEPYQYRRNRTLFPWMPAWEDRPDIDMLRYGGIQPTRTVGDWETLAFTLGGVEFEVIGAPGAEGADNLVLWLPQQKILLSGDFFGPQFPQFPNIFTMRGEKIRKPVEYLRSLDTLLALEPEVVVPSHLNPTTGGEQIRADMQKIRDAVRYVHDATVDGMNAGKTVYQLMREITLPPELDLVQNHGRVDWAVRSIFEYYASWFHFDSTTALYPVPVRDIYADLAMVAGQDDLLGLAQQYIEDAEAVRALHVVEIMLAADEPDPRALQLRRTALLQLLEQAEAGLRNDYEIYWLQHRLAETDARLAGE